MFQVQLYGILNIFINIHTKNIPVTSNIFWILSGGQCNVPVGHNLAAKGCDQAVKGCCQTVRFQLMLILLPLSQRLFHSIPSTSKSQLHIYLHIFKFHVYADAFQNLMILWDPLSPKSSTFILSCALALHLESEGQGRIKKCTPLHGDLPSLPRASLTPWIRLAEHFATTLL